MNKPPRKLMLDLQMHRDLTPEEERALDELCPEETSAQRRQREAAERDADLQWVQVPVDPALDPEGRVLSVMRTSYTDFAVVSMNDARKGKLDTLALRVMSGKELSEEERQFLGKLLLLLQHPPRMGKKATPALENNIAIAYALMRALGRKRHDVIDVIAKAYLFRSRKVGMIGKARKIRSELIDEFFDLMGGRQEVQQMMSGQPTVFEVQLLVDTFVQWSSHRNAAPPEVHAAAARRDPAPRRRRPAGAGDR